jgi:hypothetical protein
MGRIGFEFLADPADEHAQVVRTANPPGSPDLFKNLLARNDVTRVAKKNLDHSKLDPGEINLRTVGVKGSPSRYVNREIVGHDSGWYFRFAHSAQCSAHPRQKLLDYDRLGDVIVSAGVECRNEVTIALAL